MTRSARAAIALIVAASACADNPPTDPVSKACRLWSEYRHSVEAEEFPTPPLTGSDARRADKLFQQSKEALRALEKAAEANPNFRPVWEDGFEDATIVTKWCKEHRPRP